jgi:ABC-type lipoprotein release transport system permease subunit
MLFKLAWKNMWRNKIRTIITMSAIFFAVILSVLTSSLKTGVFNNLVKNMVSFYSGYIQVHKQGYWNEQILENCFEANDTLTKKILRHQNVSALAPRLESFALAASAEITKGCLIVGVEPKEENKITDLQSKLTEGEYVSKNDNAVLLSAGLALRLKLKLHDTVILISQGYHGATAAGKYFIKGLLKFGSPDLNDKALFMPLLLAQDFYGANGMLTAYVVAINNPALVKQTSTSIKKEAGSSYEVMSWEEMMPEIKQHIVTDSNNMRVIQGILYLLISFGIFSTLLMLMAERKFEMGMLVAIGMKKINLSSLLLLESVITVISGCLLGILISIPVVYYLNKHPIRIGGEAAKAYERFGFEAIFPTATQANIFVSQGITVLIIGFVLSIYTVFKVIRLNPVTAMRR